MNNKIVKERIWVVEYSDIQNCFNITTLEDSVDYNLDLFIKKNNNDYQIIALARDYDEANGLVKVLREVKQKIRNGEEIE